MIGTVAVVAATILAGAALWALAAVVSQMKGVMRQQQQMLATLYQRSDALALELREMGTVAYVKRHLDTVGVSPYLLDAGEKVEQDVADVAKVLGCTRDEAAKYILRGTIGPESRRVPRDQRPAVDGDQSSVDQRGDRRQQPQ